MPRILPILALSTLAASLVACAQSPSNEQTALVPFYVPTTLILQPHNSESLPPAFTSALAYQVLPAANADDFFVPRGEKFVYGSVPISEVSAYSILTYDAQRISSPHGTGFRYTWAVKEGTAFP